MTNQEHPLDKLQPAGTRHPRRIRRAVTTTIAVIAALVVTAIVVNEITPRPYDALFKTLIGTVKSSVQLGPYTDRVEAVDAPQHVAVKADGVPGTSLTIYRPSGSDTTKRPVILLIHGGGWVVGKASQISDYAKLLTTYGFVVANLDYALAPQQRYPTPVIQSAAALDYMHAHAAEYGGDPTKLFLAGNSAGAQISAQLGGMVADSATARRVGVTIRTPSSALRGVVLYSGPYDFTTVGRNGFPGFRAYAWSYVGQKDWKSYSRLEELSPALTATRAYPPTYMTAGDADPLLPQTYEFDAVLRAKDVDVTSRYWTGTGQALPHDYIYNLTTSAARTALADTVTFINEHGG